ncbi:MAG: glycosyltransferase family 2 protein [Ferruginibacter sp.]
MKISGFTFVRNAIKLDYPVTQSIRSILPIVDEFIVLVGNSSDETLALIRSIDSPKIKIVESVWDESLKTGGRVLAAETDKAFAQVSADSDWAFYLQGDEVVHEKYLDEIVKSAHRYLNDFKVEGLLFKYEHFYGTYDYVGDSRKWYNREIRMIRNDQSIKSYLDAQGFRKDERKLNVKLIEAYIYHYGWVKHPHAQQVKIATVGTLWGGQGTPTADDAFFDYMNHADSLKKFMGTHPAVMQQRIDQQNWTIPFDPRKKNMSFKKRLLYFIEKTTGKRLFAYKNYRLL